MAKRNPSTMGGPMALRIRVIEPVPADLQRMLGGTGGAEWGVRRWIALWPHGVG